jgi:hypothetical protein
MYKYNAAKHAVVEQATMEEPVLHKDALSSYNIKMSEYQQHLSSLKSYPVQGSVDWKDGQEVEEGKDFEIKDINASIDASEWALKKFPGPEYAAYPLQQVESEDDYDRYIEELQVKVDRDLRDKGASSKEVYDGIKWAASQLKQHFTITRKQ